MSEWSNVNLASLLSFGNGKSRPLDSGNIPVYGGNGIMSHVSQSNYDQETIIIGRVGAYCGATYYENKPIWISDNALSAKAIGKNNTKYLYYLLKNLDLNQFAEGSSHPLLTQKLLKSVETKAALDHYEQKAIASVLSSLDDKIDLLHRQNKTLESMAETLFRQWFDVDSNDEWQEKNVLDIFTLVGGGTPKTSVAEYWTDEIPWISGGDISAAHQGYLYSTEKSISLAGLQNSSAKLLPKNSTVISARGTVGKYALLARDMAFSQSNYGIVSKIGNYPFFIYLLVGFIVDDLLTAAYGSVFDTITTRTFESVNLKFPSLNSIEKFNEEISPIFSKKETNTQQIKTLETLRDTLLPKLMSGEVRVQYAEEKLESVA